MYTWMVSRFLFPLHERFKGHNSPALLRQFEESQWWPRQRLEAWQLERLRGLLTHAGRHVPYYRRLFAERQFDPVTVDSIGELRQLPLLSKADIRRYPEDFKSDGAAQLKRFNTGGSTGQPLIFFISRERISHDVAAKWRATRWWGVDIGDREAVVWGSPVELSSQDRLRTLRDRLLRSTLLPAFEMTPGKVDGFIERIRALRPRMLFGYPSALAHIARRAQERGLRLDNLAIQVAFVTAERLYDEQKDRIASVFGCRVANGYGGRDAGFVAHECPKGGMHITAEDIVVEIVNQEGDVLPVGQAGEIVITHLATRDFPFIRYRTGDVGVLDSRPCSCGRALPLLKEVQGRTTDFIIASDGTVMHGLALIYILRDISEVLEFKIIQESIERTRLLVVVGAGYQPEWDQRIRNRFKQRLGQQVEIIIEHVAEIPRTPSGKYRYVESFA